MRNNTEIAKIVGREVLDSRANPTVEAEVYTAGGEVGRAIVPSGASTGAYEAAELRDGGARYLGKGVLTAVENIKKIEKLLFGKSVIKQREIDLEMIAFDGTQNKSNIGANAILAVSLACADAAAKSLSLPLYRYLGGVNSHILPRPMMNILNGGVHADNNVDIQEFMIAAKSQKSFKTALENSCAVYHSLKKLLKEKGYKTGVGDEGGFAPDLKNDEEALSLICSAVDAAGFKMGYDFEIAIDAAASEWYTHEGTYKLPKSKKVKTSAELISYWKELSEKYPIYSIEDGLGEEDWDGWKIMTAEVSDKLQLVGDDLFVTNKERLSRGIEEKCANSVLVKVNQIGTLTEAFECIETAKKCGYSAVLSHRSGETEDTFIADIAVGTGCGQIKCGAPARGERTAKYNRLLRIEEELSFGAEF